MAKKAAEPKCKPTRLTARQRWDEIDRKLHHLEHAREHLMATVADLQASIEALKTVVAKVQAEVADLKAKPSIEQTQVDANTADINAAVDTLGAL